MGKSRRLDNPADGAYSNDFFHRVQKDVRKAGLTALLAATMGIGSYSGLGYATNEEAKAPYQSAPAFSSNKGENLESNVVSAYGNRQTAEPMFTNIWKTYRIPLKIEHGAPLVSGLEEALTFAFKNSKDKKSNDWVYAYESSLDRDPKDPGKFTPEKESGTDRFIRFFLVQRRGTINYWSQAEIIIDWCPIEKDARSLRGQSEHIQEELSKSYGRARQKLQKEGGMEEGKIGGYPAIGVKYKVNGGDYGHFTFWTIRAEDINRWFCLRFFYEKGFMDPDDPFPKVKKGIVFLKPGQK